MSAHTVKQWLPLALMAASLVLLLILQFLWLSNSFNELRHTVRRELGHIVEHSVRHVQDSLAMRLMDSLGINSDSIIRLVMPSPTHAHRIGTHHSAALLSDTAKNTSFILSISAKSDSLSKNYLRFSPRRARFVNTIGLLAAGIRIDSTLIVKRVRNEIHERQMQVEKVMISSLQFTRPPTEEEWHQMRENELQEPHIIRERVFILPGWGYQAQIEGFMWNVWQQMTPLILFSVFLTTVTVMAFALMYRSMRQQQRLSELKNDFIGNVTHELKTPVATVSVAIEALNNFNVLQNRSLTAEYLDICKTELRRLSLMIDQIMKIAVIEQKGIHVENTTVDLQQTVQQVIASMRPQLEHFNVHIQLHTEGESWQVHGDSTHLTNIVFNLLENAIKYSPQNPHIKVQLIEKQDNIVLSVQDNGVGIAPEYHKKIFDKFFRVPTGNVHNVKGYGLGLSYVANVVKSHGGTITLQSEPNKGSTFYVTLPKIKAAVRQWQYEPFVF
ncbi:MAG: ATP-binding protein [Bernardetiaceae bacterium]|nr:ATP-binding protein [Bernardetiaceae bacterium]